MSTKKVVVYVEGNSDKRLLDAIIWSTGLESIEVAVINGDYRSIKNIAPRIRVLSKEGKLVALVLDADENYDKRRTDTEMLIEEQGLKIDNLFFLPNNESAGDLEKMLEQMMVDRHRAIMNCFDKYEACIRQLPMNYRSPNRKARVYAYCEAIGIDTNAAERDYCNRDHWKLDAPEVVRLTVFLQGLANDTL